MYRLADRQEVWCFHRCCCERRHAHQKMLTVMLAVVSIFNLRGKFPLSLLTISTASQTWFWSLLLSVASFFVFCLKKYKYFYTRISKTWETTWVKAETGGLYTGSCVTSRACSVPGFFFPSFSRSFVQPTNQPLFGKFIHLHLPKITEIKLPTDLTKHIKELVVCLMSCCILNKKKTLSRRSSISLLASCQWKTQHLLLAC